MPGIDSLRRRANKLTMAHDEMPQGLDAQERWWHGLTAAERAACTLPGAGLFRWLDEQITASDARGLTDLSSPSTIPDAHPIRKVPPATEGGDCSASAFGTGDGGGHES